jgi:hypothetical protein
MKKSQQQSQTSPEQPAKLNTHSKVSGGRGGTAEHPRFHANRVVSTYTNQFSGNSPRSTKGEDQDGWNGKKETATQMIFEKVRIREIAHLMGVSERQIYRWKNEEEFFRRHNDFWLTVQADAMLRIQQAVHALDQKDYPNPGKALRLFKRARKLTERIDYSDPRFGIPLDQLNNWMNKATCKSLNAKLKRGKRCETAKP